MKTIYFLILSLFLSPFAEAGPRVVSLQRVVSERAQILEREREKFHMDLSSGIGETGLGTLLTLATGISFLGQLKVMTKSGLLAHMAVAGVDGVIITHGAHKISKASSSYNEAKRNLKNMEIALEAEKLIEASAAK